MPALIRFGLFELDLEAAELRTNGQRSRLPEQQFQILQMLLLAEGRVVSREEIRKRLWPNDTVVEFDRSINTAMMKLRITLGDTGDKSRLIETLPRRGYRLMVPVEQEIPELPGPGTGIDKPGSLVGQRISHYRVLEILGGGGMGVVYKAVDLKLDRTVALKFLPEEMGGDQKAVARFEREARAVSALDHPNICPIYEFGEQDKRPFIVMPLLDGRNLRDVLAECESDMTSPLPLQQVLDLSVQIVSGLQAAHDTGIIHRDIKPANIFITRRGVAKILDFGIAKRIPAGKSGESEAEDGPSGEHETSGTATVQTLSLTRTGIAVGSEGYMSPEQVRGEKLDARTDLFSFGLSLFEMATGQRPFSGSSPTAIREAILCQATVPARQLNPQLSPRLESVISKALEKDRELRYQSAAEMLTELLECSGEDIRYGGSVPSVKPKVWRRPVYYGLALLGAVIVTIGGLALWRAHFLNPGVPRVLRFTKLTNDGQSKLGPLITDGSRIYFNEHAANGRNIIAQVSVAGGEVVPLTVPLDQPSVLDLSKRGTDLLVANYEGRMGSSLWVQPVAGGSPRRVGAVLAVSAAFAADEKSIIYSDNSAISSVYLDGRPSGKVFIPGYGEAFGFRFSSDSNILRFSRYDHVTDTTTIMQANEDGTNLHKMFQGQSGEWTPNGRFFIFVKNTDNKFDLWAMPEGGGLTWGKREHSPVPLTPGSLELTNPLPAKDGKEIFAIGTTREAEVVRYDSHSREFVPYLSGISADGLAFSADGQWVAYTSYPDGMLWRSRVDGSERLQLTFPPMKVVLPRWSPDGKQVAFNATVPGAPWNIYIVSASGGTSQRILPSDQKQMDVNWSPDGKSLIFASTLDPDMWISVIDLSSRRVSILPGSHGLFSPHWSPDGRYISGTATGYDRLMLFKVATQKWTKVSNATIGYPTYSHDGKYLYFKYYPSADTQYRIVRLRLSDRKMETVAELDNIGRLTTGALAQWFGLAPDDSPLFARDISTQEIYALEMDWP